MKTVSVILEGLQSDRINEDAKFSFAKGYGCALKENLGSDLMHGDLFYCTDITKSVVTLVKQEDKSFKLIMPIKMAETVFTNVSTLEDGTAYTLKIDLPYIKVVWADNFDWSEDFIKKYTKKFKGEDWVVFPKGTKFKYDGQSMSGDDFTVDGKYVPISDLEEMGEDIGKKLRKFSDIFKM